jgi:membrane protein implicated in regulation of membrane protease activity
MKNMGRRRDLIVANLAAVVVLILALVAGWWEAASFGLAVLVVLDLIVLIRERQARSEHETKERDGGDTGSG